MATKKATKRAYVPDEQQDIQRQIITELRAELAGTLKRLADVQERNRRLQLGITLAYQHIDIYQAREVELARDTAKDIDNHAYVSPSGRFGWDDKTGYYRIYEDRLFLAS